MAEIHDLRAEREQRAATKLLEEVRDGSTSYPRFNLVGKNVRFSPLIGSDRNGANPHISMHMIDVRDRSGETIASVRMTAEQFWAFVSEGTQIFDDIGIMPQRGTS